MRRPRPSRIDTPANFFNDGAKCARTRRNLAASLVDPGHQVFDDGLFAEARGFATPGLGRIEELRAAGCVDARDGPPPPESLCVGAHALPRGSLDAERQWAPLHLNAELDRAACGEQIERAPRGSRLINEIEAHVCKQCGDLALGSVSYHRHGHDRSARAPPPKPERKHPILEL